MITMNQIRRKGSENNSNVITNASTISTQNSLKTYPILENIILNMYLSTEKRINVEVIIIARMVIIDAIVSSLDLKRSTRRISIIPHLVSQFYHLVFCLGSIIKDAKLLYAYCLLPHIILRIRR